MSTQQERAAIMQILEPIHHPTIFELGAYQGEDAEWLIGFCAERERAGCDYVIVEADPENAAVIRKKIAAGTFDLRSGESERPGIWFKELAIVANYGLVEFNVCDNSVGHQRGSGSVRNPTGHLEHFPWCQFNRTVMVQGWTLDELLRTSHFVHIDLIWSDLQGAERDMITGGQVALKHTRYLFMEAEPDVELYEGQALKPELLAMLPDWELLEDFGYNVLLRNRNFTP